MCTENEAGMTIRRTCHDTARRIEFSAFTSLPVNLDKPHLARPLMRTLLEYQFALFLLFFLLSEPSCDTFETILFHADYDTDMFSAN